MHFAVASGDSFASNSYDLASSPPRASAFDGYCSSENLFYDVHRQLVAWNELISARTTVRLLSTTWTAAQVARRLKELLHGLWSECWCKAPSNTHKTPPTKGKDYLKGGHTSVYRLMQAARAGP